MKAIAPHITAIPFLAGLFLAGCPAMNTGYNDPYSTSPRYDSRYDSPYYGNQYDYERRREAERLDRERDELERERERIARERERLEREKYRRPAPSKNQVQRERCPSGWQPSERKCSDKERRRGCQDMRTPSGLGCVRGR